MTESGTCEPCPVYEAVDGRTCIEPSCSDTQVVDKLGICTECSSYTRKQDSRTCSPDVCTWRERIDIDGTCLRCSIYELVSKDGRQCETIPNYLFLAVILPVFFIGLLIQVFIYKYISASEYQASSIAKPIFEKAP